jgi:hypothetical protein
MEQLRTIRTEARELISAADRTGLSLRLIGGLGVSFRCPSAGAPPFARDYSDIDCVALAKPRALADFLETEAWAPSREFNLYNGDARLLYTSPEGTKLDVFIDRFDMCHEICFIGRMPADSPAAYASELLMTKLQIRDITGKDLSDAACLLWDCRLCRDDSGLNVDRIVHACAQDWGMYRSFTINLEKVVAWAGARPDCAEIASAVSERVRELAAAIEKREKPLAWRLRAAVGDKLRWYTEVDQTGEVGR